MDKQIESLQVDRHRRPAEVIPPTDTLECRVCGAPAHGYNFDQISCESCKAFFRRNALRHLPGLPCRFSGSCLINVESRRTCTYCRLKKCFEVNMKKEWIRTDEERQLRELKRLYKKDKQMDKHSQISLVVRKKNRLRLVPQPVEIVMNPIFPETNLVPLTNLDHSWMNNINSAYDDWALQCDTDRIRYYSLERTSLVHFLNDEQQMYRSLIDFYKQIPEFRNTAVDDQVLLIKCNLTHLVHVHHVLKDRFMENVQIGRLMSRWLNPSFHDQMCRTRRQYDYFLEHPIILKLALVVMMFTINLSRMPEADLSFDFVDRRSLLKSQNVYLTLLWNYLNVIFDERGAVRAMGVLVFQYLRYQQLMNDMDVFIMQHFRPEQFHPLTKSALRLT